MPGLLGRSRLMKANNDTQVPRCDNCQRYMEKLRENSRMVTYECCGRKECVVKPEFRGDPRLHPEEHR
jgi:hypothetical protein